MEVSNKGAGKMESLAEVKQLTKVFKQDTAVKEATFSIKKGEIVAILGPNGAGKTTTISMMLGLLHPTKGEATLFGMDPREKSVRERIGVMLQEVSLMDGLKVREIIQLFRSYYPHPLSMEELIRLTGLEDKELNKRTEKLSGGQKRRVGFALALAGNPDLLFFGEPTVGMDITARQLFWDTVKELSANGKTIIFSTHYLQEADDISDRIILFHKGRIIADAEPNLIKKQLTKQSVSFISEQDIPEKIFLQEAFVTEVYKQDSRTHIVTDDTDAVLRTIFTTNLDVSDIRVEKGRLDDAFSQLVDAKKDVS